MANSFNARGYRPVQLVDPGGKCTGCTLCAVMCPDAVLTVYRLPAKTGVVRMQAALAA
jgi:2-oxoglutarate ferredoxin oxidoreductase subunit delta